MINHYNSYYYSTTTTTTADTTTKTIVGCHLLKFQSSLGLVKNQNCSEQIFCLQWTAPFSNNSIRAVICE